MSYFGMKIIPIDRIRIQIIRAVKRLNKNNNDSPVPNMIAQGTSIVGDLISNGDFRIEGKLKGTITASGRIVIGETGEVEGEVSCQHADISGTVKGNLKVEELTMLKIHARFEGNITTKQLSIEPGALFSGECIMGKPLKKPDDSNKK